MYIMTELRIRYFTSNNKGMSSILSIPIQFRESTQYVITYYLQ